MSNEIMILTDGISLLDRAICFAAVKHAGVSRKGSSVPYVTHVLEALEIVSRMTEDEEIRAAAVLHDTLEDTDATKDDLIDLFGSRVADLVAAESENKREDLPAEDTWKIRKQETVRHLAGASTDIRMLALGDKLSNIRAMTRDYREMGEDLWKKFNQQNPVLQGWYYGSLANIFGQDEVIRKTDACREYYELCSQLFSKTYDGNGNLIEDEDEKPEAADAEPDREKDSRIQIGFFLAETMKNFPAGWTPMVLILDRTDSEDMLEIQKMAAVLELYLRNGETGLNGAHLTIVNEPDSQDVSWKRTEDGYAIHLCAASGKHWSQVAYQLGYTMMHCLIDRLDKDGKPGIGWAEELICETAALDILNRLCQDWERTPFAEEDPGYDRYIGQEIRNYLADTGTSALYRCGDRDELRRIGGPDRFGDRLDESHDLFYRIGYGDLHELAKIRKYESDDLLLYTHYWRAFGNESAAVDYICRLQERIPGCELPRGIPSEVDLRDTRPTEDQKKAFASMIRALRPLPCEHIIFSFMDPDKEDREQIGLVFYQLVREKDGRIDAEIRLDTATGRKMYGIRTDDDGAAAILNGILETGEAPDLEDWEDFTEEVFGKRRENICTVRLP